MEGRFLIAHLTSSSVKGSRSRSVCVWEPKFRDYIATADGGVPALQAAGFEMIEKDANGTPFLVMTRRVTVQGIHEYVASAKSFSNWSMTVRRPTFPPLVNLSSST